MDVVLVFVILAVTIALFLTEKLPVDLVALLALAMVVVTGLVSVEEGVSGFSHPATITVGAMFVLSAGLQRTGALLALARWLTRFGKHPLVLLALLMPAVALASAFINNTPVVAVFLPLVLAVCAKRKLSPSKFLIPLSYASQFGGVCTLIGTSTNLLVSALSDKAGHGAFGMFEFSALGLIMVAIGTVYFLTIGYWLLPERRGEELVAAYQLGEYLTELRVMRGSPLIGQTLVAARFGALHDVTVVEIVREQQKLFTPAEEPIREGDILLVRGHVKELLELKQAFRLEIEPEVKLRDETLRGENLALVESVVPPRSPLVGQTLRELNFRRQFNAIVLALQRRGQTIRSQLRDLRLRVGDALLLLGPPDDIARLRQEDQLVVLSPVDEPALRRHRAPLATGIVALVVLGASLPLFGGRPLPILATALLGGVALVLTRVISPEEAYRAIDWRVIFLLAGILPLGIALEKSGAARLLAQQGVRLVGDLGPWAVLAMLYVLTAVLTEFMSNNAAAVLLTPVALSTATTLGLSPKPFLIAIMFAASTAFSTPVGYHTNTMIYNPGGYRFGDYVKVGLPLNCLFAAAAVYFIPRFFPF